jgi:hypothetical protein
VIWASGRAYGRTLLLAAALLLAALAVAAEPGRSGAETLDPASPQTSLLLRLPDLQIGYFELGGGCAHISAPEDSPRKLASFVSRYKPFGCMALYLRLFEAGPAGEPDPPVVGSAVLRGRSDSEADAAWTLAPLLLSRVLGDQLPEELPATATVGEATRMFHAGGLLSPLESSTFVVWRSGNTLAVVCVGGSSTATNDSDAIEFARRQQVHLDAPTPYAAAERDDSDAGLDDPAIKLPVYWLGRAFRPGAELPPSHLLGGGSVESRLSSAAVEQLRLEYGRRLTLDSWTPARFRTYLKSQQGRQLRAWPCTTATTVSLPLGRARVYAGYRGDPARCPKRSPDHYRADVFLEGAVVQIDPLAPQREPFNFGERPGLDRPCRSCVARRARPPYDSRRGVLAIARSLTLRVPRAPRGTPAP